MVTQPLDSRPRDQAIAPTRHRGDGLLRVLARHQPNAQAVARSHPGGADGPWAEAACRSIQELVRGRHQCLVAEVFFPPDATDSGETPGRATTCRNATSRSCPPTTPVDRTRTGDAHVRDQAIGTTEDTAGRPWKRCRCGRRDSGPLTHATQAAGGAIARTNCWSGGGTCPPTSEVTVQLGGASTDEVVRDSPAYASVPLRSPRSTAEPCGSRWPAQRGFRSRWTGDCTSRRCSPCVCPTAYRRHDLPDERAPGRWPHRSGDRSLRAQDPGQQGRADPRGRDPRPCQ